MAKVTATMDDLDDSIAAKNATGFVAGEAFIKGGNLIIHWEVHEVGEWLTSLGYNSLVPLFQQQNINGSVLSRLNDRLLREIGVTNVGTRMQLMNEIVKVQALARTEWRNQVIWADEQYRPGCCDDFCPLGFPCCHCCPELCYGKPIMYTLTNSKLNMMYQKKICCPNWCPPCCGTRIRSDNIDLTLVLDVDVNAASSMCCCGHEPLGNVMISTMDGKQNFLDLKSSECQKVCSILTNAKEEAGIVAGMHAMSMMR